MAKKKETTDWKTAGEECLTTALNRANELARDATEFKSLESLIKTVADVVGAGLYLSRGNKAPQHQDGSGDDE